jgi:hypothetical protein
MTRVYRCLLHVYPRWFREQYEADLVRAFTADRAHYQGRLGSIPFWMFVAKDLAISACRIRWAAAPTTQRAIDLTPRRSLMEALAQDLRHAFRQLVRRPGFTAVAALSLTLGIGGNAIIFAFFDGFVLHPFAYPEPDRVVTIGSTFPRMSSEERFIEAISAGGHRPLRTVWIAACARPRIHPRRVGGGPGLRGDQLSPLARTLRWRGEHRRQFHKGEWPPDDGGWSDAA